MRIGTAVLAVLASAAHGAEGFGAPRTFVSRTPTAVRMSTKEKEATDEKKKDAPPVNIGWDSHKAIVRDFIALVFSTHVKSHANLRLHHQIAFCNCTL